MTNGEFICSPIHQESSSVYHPAAKSDHSGFFDSINTIFFFRDPALSCFSRAIAFSMLLEFADIWMMRRMLLNLRDRAERLASVAVVAGP